MIPLTKIFGPPGTGKTTRLLTIVEEALASGTQPERIAFLAFTKKAAREAQERAITRFGFAPERMPHFRTLHSMAFKSNYARKDDIIQPKHFEELGDMLNFRFSPREFDEAHGIPMGTLLGDRVVQVEALSRQRMVPLKQQWVDSDLHDVPWTAVEQWDRGLRRYKDSRGMMDYTDLLEQFNETLDVDLFIVDEAQDLSNLQWRVVRTASRGARKIFIAGDDDQCIYGWAGAEVDRFLSFRSTHKEILPLSYRLPRRIFDVSEAVISNVENREPKVWRSREEDGRVQLNVMLENADFSRGTWLCMARNKSQLIRFEYLLKNQGYPYRIGERHSTDNATTRAILSWENWRKGQPIQPRQIKEIQALLPQLPESFQPHESVLLKDAPLPAHFSKMNWMDALTDIPPVTREYLRACLANKEHLQGDPRIIVSTIHQAKGGEAENVLLLSDISLRPWQQLNTDHEYRVLYVAVTRAKETLTITAPESNQHYQI